ncbi:MAG: acyltransferase, partial [Butyrivibrio sp.]|nr:acyltransferase [Butyrivibrio sp.]
GEAIDAIARFSVPFFFALSGKYLLKAGESDRTKIRSSTGKRLKTLLASTGIVYLAYTIFSLTYHLTIAGENVGSWFSSKYNLSEARWFLLFNSGKFIYDGSYTFDHLWFLFALIYVYALIYVFAPVLKKWYKALIVILLFFLYLGEALQTYYPIRPFGISISTWYVVRNWLFVGMPFVLMGILFADFFDKKRKTHGNVGYEEMVRKLKLPAMGVIVAGAVLSVIEYQIFGKKEVFIGSLLMVIGIFLLSESAESGFGIIWKLGKTISGDIYFYHVMIIAVLDIFLPLPMGIKPPVVMAICVILFSLINSELWRMGKKR